MYRIIVIVFLLGACCPCLFAQDANYWTHAYGTRASILGGAVVGSVDDNSAVYYNPGGLGFVQNSSLSITANAYQMDIYKLQSPVPGGVSLNSLQIVALPLMVSGLLQLKNSSRHYLGYSILTRNQSRIRVDERTDRVLTTGLTDTPGDSLRYNGQFNFSYSNYELWAGFCYAYRAHPNVSIGVTTFLGYRNTNSDLTVEARAHQPDSNRTASARVGSNFLMNHLEMHWRIGIAVHYPKFQLGLTFSTPSASIYGEAKVGRDQTVLNLNLPGSTFLKNVQGFDYQKHRPAVYKQPMSLAFGFAVQLHRRVWIHGTIEWFVAVPRYTSIQAENRPFYQTSSTLGEVNSNNAYLSVSGGSRNLVNSALAFEIMVSPKVTTYISYRTDFSGLKGQNLSSGNNIAPGYSRYDVYHITVGFKLRRKKSDLYAGFRFGFSSGKDVLHTVNFDNPARSNLLFGQPVDLKAQVYLPAVIIGYTVRSK